MAVPKPTQEQIESYEKSRSSEVTRVWFDEDATEVVPVSDSHGYGIVDFNTY